MPQLHLSRWRALFFDEGTYMRVLFTLKYMRPDRCLHIHEKKRSKKSAYNKKKTIFFGRWMKFCRWRKYYDSVIVAFVTKHIYTWLSNCSEQRKKDAVGKEKVINYFFQNRESAMLLGFITCCCKCFIQLECCWCCCYCSWWEWDHSEEFPLRDVHADGTFHSIMTMDLQSFLRCKLFFSI